MKKDIDFVFDNEEIKIQDWKKLFYNNLEQNKTEKYY